MEGQFCDASTFFWMEGLAFSVVGGGILAAPNTVLLRWLAVPKNTTYSKLYPMTVKQCVQAALVGGIERFAITLIATYDLESAGAFAIAWVGLKLASSWNRTPTDAPGQGEGAIAAMVGSLVSALVAIASAMFICGKFLR